MKSRYESKQRLRIGRSLPVATVLVVAAIQACDSRPLPLASSGGGSGGSLGGGGLGIGGQNSSGGASGTGGGTSGAGGSAGGGGACGSPSCTPGNIQEFRLPPRTIPASPLGITAGPDGNLWFTEFQASAIGRITPNGAITEFPLAPVSEPSEIITGPDGHMWFGLWSANGVGRIAVDGTLQVFMLPTPASGPGGLAAGPDGNVWISEYGASKIGRFQPNGQLVEFPTPSPNANPWPIVAGPDGNLWFAEPAVARIGIMTTAGVSRELAGSPSIRPHGMAIGGDGNIWFTDPGAEQVGTLFPGGMVTLFPALTTANVVAPSEIARGPHGELWYTLELARDKTGHLVRLGLDGAQTEYSLPHTSPGIQAPIGGVTAGPDGAIWFTEYVDDIIGRLVPP